MKINILFSFSLIIFLLTTEATFAQTADAGPDQEVCINQTNMNAVPPPDGFTGAWSIISGFCVIDDITSYNTLVTELLEEDNELRWTITDGETTVNDNVIITNNYPTQAQTADDEEICQNTYTLNANIHGSEESGLWTLELGTGTIADPTDNYTEVTGIGTGTNTFKWTISKGICNSFDIITITNNTIVAVAGDDQVICFDYTSLAADNPSPGSGSWSVVSSSGSPVFSNPNSHITDITELGINTNSLKWETVKGNCTDYDIVIITSNKPTQADAGVDQVSCDDQSNLAGNNPIYGTGEWSVISGAGTFVNINEYNTQVTNINTGSNEYEWEITYNGCSSEDTVEIYYDYFTADAGVDDETCENSYTLDGNDPSPGTGEWRVTGGSGTFADPNQNNTVVTNLISGENTYEWKITHGACEHADYVVITRNNPSVADAGPDRESCGGNVTLAAVSPVVGTGSWSVIFGTGIFADSNLNTTSVSNIGIGSNTYRWTVKYANCSNYDDVIVSNNYVSADAGSDQIVCGTTSVLDGNQPQGGETGTWQILAGTSTVSNINLYNSSVTDLSSGLNKFRWTISKGSCEDYDDIEIINNQYNASASVSGPSDICEDYASILGNSPPSGGSASWSISFGSGNFDNSTDESTVVRNLDIGENIIRWTITKDGCPNYDEITINRNTVYSDAGDDQTVCDINATLYGNTLTGNTTGLWTKVSGSGTIENPTNNVTNVFGLSNGINTFSWTVIGNGCEDSDNVIITNNSFFTFAGSNQQICSSSTNLTASDPFPGYGYWEVVTGTGLFSNPSSHNTIVSGIPDISTNVYKWTAFKNGCSDSDEVTVQNNLVTADAGDNFDVCTNNATLNGNDPTYGIGVWSVQMGGGIIADENLYNSAISGLSLNENIIRWTITNLTCITYDEVTITNNTVTATAGPDQAICENYTQLSGQVPPSGGTGFWEIISGYGDFQDQSLYNTQVNNLASGFNTFRWTVFYNECNSEGDEVTINNKSFTADAGEDQELEDFVTSTFMTATLPVGGSGSWILLAGGGNIISDTDPGTEVTDLPTGINVFQWTVNYNGCSSYDAVNITALDFEADAGTDKTICADYTTMGAVNYNGTPQVWSVIQGSGNFDDPNQHDTWVYNVSEGINIYRWSVTICGVTAYDDVLVFRVNSYAGDDQTVCDNYTTLNGNIPQYSYGLWSLVSGSAVIVEPTAYNSEVINLGLSNNLFKWTIYGTSCSVDDYVNIYNDKITADAGNDQEVYSPYAFMYAVLPQNADAIWSVVSGNGIFEDISDPYTEVTGLYSGNNIFRWTVSNENCNDFDDVLILYHSPNNITDFNQSYIVYPNPVSDFLYIETNDLKNYSLKVYDIFGKLIYSDSEVISNSYKINFSSFRSGTYFINVNDGKKANTIKVVKK
ncbi:MAG: T9SS type A sorting domain-containing protein [Bacteroidales bacterium]|nr:T9SS type A sorting domain-containing protein [Bacteroidales bacterium]